SGSREEATSMNPLEPDELARLVDQYGAALVLYARQWCQCPEDVVQQAFVLLAQQGSAPASPAGWLYRAVRNGAISAARSASRRGRREAAVAHRGEPWFEVSARDDRGPALGPTLIRRNRAVDRLIDQQRPSLVPEGFGCATGKAWRVMSQEEPLEELKAIEAALASLVPRRDVLDRDRLMYRAGWAAARAARRGRAAARAWAVAFSTMTAVAATLLVALLTRWPTQVPGPTARPGAPGEVEGTVAAGPVDRVGPAANPSPEGVAAWPPAGPAGDGWSRAPLGPTAPYPLLLARVLERGLDAWAPEVSTPSPAREGPSPPSSYRELREAMLDGRPVPPARWRILPDLLLPGAKS
ncbi:MAG: hypothetical protein NUV77_19555, partial [Thermoguttaceae bacterium]|nr:hypothetical protein [Thermoguttaceae bacterium]